MKFVTAGVVFSEVPDEISLELGISNCPFKCEGCHSPFLQEDIGDTLDVEKLRHLIKENRGITCVLFSGGDASYKEVEYLCKVVKDDFPSIKTAWYSGRTTLPEATVLDYFDYIKLGPYKKDLGGLDSPTTNQRLYKVVDGKLIDITSKIYDAKTSLQ